MQSGILRLVGASMAAVLALPMTVNIVRMVVVG
jgi:hypothetical protein